MVAHNRLSQRNLMCSTAARQSRLVFDLREQLTVLYLFQLVEPKFMREQICIICIYYTQIQIKHSPQSRNSVLEVFHGIASSVLTTTTTETTTINEFAAENNVQISDKSANNSKMSRLSHRISVCRAAKWECSKKGRKRVKGLQTKARKLWQLQHKANK